MMCAEFAPWVKRSPSLTPTDSAMVVPRVDMNASATQRASKAATRSASRSDTVQFGGARRFASLSSLEIADPVFQLNARNLDVGTICSWLGLILKQCDADQITWATHLCSPWRDPENAFAAEGAH